MKIFCTFAAGLGLSLIAFMILSSAQAWAKESKTLATEYPSKNETAVIAEMVNDLKQKLEKDYPHPKRMERDAHPKQHGLLRAEFTVLDGLPETLRVGLFARPDTYKAYVRYSNAFARSSDIERDSRGMAIKLMGVPGEKLLPELKTATTQDFVLMSSHNFVTKDAEGFSKFTKAGSEGGLKSVLFFLSHPRMTRRFMKLRKSYPDLQSIEWGSTVPYLLGEGQAVKYRAIARKPTQATLPDKKTASQDYLRERLARDLAMQAYIVDFYVQVQTDANTMPIEDARIIWDAKKSPFIKVAEIKILKQIFDTPEQQLYGDQLSFNPWHSLPAHRPLGSINRARKAIYQTMSEFRHERNGERPEEPTDWREF